MTAIIDKDKVWLKQQIENGVESFLDCQRDYFIELLKRYVYEQIYINGC